ncbi:unnamed protein product, partial [Brugia timori]|uniref:Reverse transcriptase domain-containing protein n=1 Tax=Brugia timori TaxID=42155 RepID=A0A0R3QBG2_9BILA
KFGPCNQPSASTPLSRSIPHGPAPLVTAAQVASIVRTLDNRKAPGPDNISNSTVKLLHRLHPGVLPAIYTACLVLGHFPTPWKRGRVVFIPKPLKDPTKPDSYRPITLLSCLGKVLEVVLNQELTALLEAEHLLHSAQFGFRQHRGTEDAVHDALDKIAECRTEYTYTAAVSFDIRGAFDNASWKAILDAEPLALAPGHIHRCLESYFLDRVVTCEGINTHLTRGCPQGSVLGPTLWNIVHDCVIRGLEPEYPRTTCYADDTLVIVGAHTKPDIEAAVRTCITTVTDLVGLNGLSLNTDKTEVLCFVDMRIPPGTPAADHGWPSVQHHGADIRMCRSIKYLGVHLDNTGHWDVHFKHILERCNTALAPLMTLCHRTFGYSNAARRIMVQGAIYSHLLYCSSAWYHRLKVRAYRHAVQMIQRRCDILSARLYSTTSATAAAVINGSQPLDLRIICRSIQWLLKHERQIPLWEPFSRLDASPPPKEWYLPLSREWQRRWATSSTGEWTRELFPSIQARASARLPNIDFWLGQALTGHGVFASFLHRFRRRDSPNCPCGATDQTAKHVLRFCRLYSAGRPVDWHRLTSTHFQYMRRVVRLLWMEENPDHPMDTYDRYAHPRASPSLNR